MPRPRRTIELPDVLTSVERAIRSIRDKNDKRAESALRTMVMGILRLYHVSWLQVADDLVRAILNGLIREGKDVSKCQAFLARLDEARFDNGALRATLVEFARTCSPFNICYLANGPVVYLEYYRTAQQTEVDEHIKSLRKIAQNL